VRLPGATIGDQIDCADGTFINKDADALSADGINVKGSVFLRDGFKAEGEVRLLGATIGGILTCRDGTFINKDADALNADRINVKGSVFLRDGFKAEGAVRLLGATIGGDLACSDGTFINKDANALSADRINVKGSVFLRDGFRAEGEVRLLGATIGGILTCRDGTFINKDADALNADRINVKGSVFLRDGFKAEGKVSLVAATIDEYFIWTGVTAPSYVKLDLRSASVGTLWDDSHSWPEKGNLWLHGLVYEKIDDRAPRDAERRIEWLHRQGDQFLPQPYEQLAEVFRKSGQEEDAKKILIQKNKDRARFTELNFFEKLKHYSLGLSIGYGYRPWRAFLWILGFLALGWLFFESGYRAEIMRRTNELPYLSRESARGNRMSDDYPKFNSFIYSLDTFVPLVDLRHASYWIADANLKGQLRISQRFGLPISGKWIRYYMWVHIIAGWIFTTLFIGGLSGLIRR